MAVFAVPSRLAQVSPNDFTAIRALQADWSKQLHRDLHQLDALYAEIIQTAEALLNPPSKTRAKILPFRRRAGAPLPDESAYVFLIAASGSRYLTQQNGKNAAQQRLAEHHAGLLALIERFTQPPDRQLSARHLPTGTGNLSDCGQALIELYFHHLGYGPQTDRLRSELAQVIPGFMRAFPSVHGGLITYLLGNHPDGAAAVAPLLAYYVTEMDMIGSRTVADFAFEMLGPRQDRESFYFRNSAALIAPLLPWVAADPAARLDPFIDTFVLGPLDCAIPDRETEIARLRSSVAATEAQIANPPPPELRLLSPQAQATHLKRTREQLRELEENFDGWVAERWQNAVQRVAVSATTRKTLKAIVKGVAPARHPLLDRLLADATAYGKRPRKFPMPPETNNRFNDPGLKLMVIEALMYQQDRLQPRFDIYEFAKEYDAREISVEADGYEIIPEAQTYFRNLAIPDDLLAGIESLHLSSGLDGGAGFMKHLWPFWDPGSGDRPVAVTDAAIADLALLPNLKRISGLENGDPSGDLLAALAARGITLINEEDA